MGDCGLSNVICAGKAGDNNQITAAESTLQFMGLWYASGGAAAVMHSSLSKVSCECVGKLNCLSFKESELI